MIINNFQLLNILNATHKHHQFALTKYSVDKTSQLVTGTHPHINARFTFELKSDSTLLVITGTNSAGINIIVYIKTELMFNSILVPDLLLGLAALHNFKYISNSEFVAQNGIIRKIYKRRASDATRTASDATPTTNKPSSSTIIASASQTSSHAPSSTISSTSRPVVSPIQNTDSFRSHVFSFLTRKFLGKHSIL